jgi:uncharacterized protein
MKTFDSHALDDLALGATLLGSGGGGDPAYELLMAKQAFEQFEAPLIEELDAVPDDAVVVPLAFMGAPLVGMERIPSGREYEAIMKKIELTLLKPPTHLVAAEIGGANAFTPLIAGAVLGLPVIDGDTLGRAFPELQMSSCHLRGIAPSPAFLSDPLERTAVVEEQNALAMENQCRKLCVQMGSSAAVALYLMSGSEAKQALIPGTVSQAVRLGELLRLEGVQGICRSAAGRLLGTGVITGIDQSIRDGFLSGNFIVEHAGGAIVVEYRNEFLAAYQGGNVLACTPEIIIPVEEDSGHPITSESLQYGLRVSLLALPSPDIWTTPEGLALVGPEIFNIGRKK